MKYERKIQEIVYTKEQFIKAIRKARKNTRIYFDEVIPITLTSAKSKYMLNLEKELRKIKQNHQNRSN